MIYEVSIIDGCTQRERVFQSMQPPERIISAFGLLRPVRQMLKASKICQRNIKYSFDVHVR